MPRALLNARRPRALLAGRAPLIVLTLVSALSLGARAYRLGGPCVSPCRTASAHALLSDESYYVDAAQIIAGIRPPKALAAGQYPSYRDAPLGTDPNAEHPQGVKLVIAGAIELFGNGPFAWRIGSLLFGSLAILGMYALVLAAGGQPWLAVGAATLMAADNLMIVFGRIAFLDIYALAPMLWAVALYLRGRVLGAAVLLALADCFKEVSVYALIVLGLLELFRGLLHACDGDGAHAPLAAWRWRPALGRLTVVVVGSSALFILGLWVMGLIAPPSVEGTRRLVAGGPFNHLSYIINFAKGFSNSTGSGQETGYPWQWWYGHGVLTLLRVNPSASACHIPPDYPPGVTCLADSLPGRGPHAVLPVSRFRAMMSPPIIALAIPALVVCAVIALRRRGSHAPGALGISVLALAWTIGTWVPFELQNLVYHRLSWIYYMVIVLPGVYVAVAQLALLLWRRRNVWLRGAVAVWGLTVLAAAVVMYPFVAGM